MIHETHLDDLLAKEALSRLVVSYSRAVDRRDFALLRELYAPEALDQHGEMYEGGIDGYIAFLHQALARYEATTHYVLQTHFEVRGDYAEGEVHKLNYHREAGPPRRDVITASRFFDHYIRRAGRWYFLRRTISLDWVQCRDVVAENYENFAAQSPRGRADGGDLSYEVLKLFPRLERDL